MSIKVPESSKQPRRLRKPIEPIHVEELLAGAGMSGFLGILAPHVPSTHLEKLVREVDTHSTKLSRVSGAPKFDGETVGLDAQLLVRASDRILPTLPGARPVRFASSQMSARVASVVRKVEALTELIKVTAKKGSGE
jgi:hypothetical protein